jgi:hypothetical protein
MWNEAVSTKMRNAAMSVWMGTTRQFSNRTVRIPFGTRKGSLPEHNVSLSHVSTTSFEFYHLIFKIYVLYSSTRFHTLPREDKIRTHIKIPKMILLYTIASL